MRTKLTILLAITVGLGFLPVADTLAAEPADPVTTISVSAGHEHSCALLSDGGVSCWGWYTEGRLGRPLPTSWDHLRPGRVPGIDDAVAVAAGAFHSCAVRADGSVWCWGSDSTDQLGPAHEGSGFQPVEVKGVRALPAGTAALPVEISAGWAHTCLLPGNGTVACWGSNSTGQLGFPDVFLRVDDLPRVPGIAGAVEVDAGYGHTCARLVDGTVRCWGANSAGQLGNGSAEPRSAPVTVSGLADATAIAVSDDGNQFGHSCAVRGDGTLWCWGANHEGQLGSWPRISQRLPAPVPGVTGATDVAAGAAFTCVTHHIGTSCFGADDAGQLGTSSRLRGEPLGAVPSLTAATLSAGGKHACAVDAAGAISCWGDDSRAQLGHGADPAFRAPAHVTIPTPIAHVPPVADLSAGYFHTCASRHDGRVSCWGSDASEELGNGDGTHRQSPGEVDLPAAAERIITSGRSTCAVSSGPAPVSCWGGHSSIRTPRVQHAESTGIVHMESAGHFTTTCTLRDTGALACTRPTVNMTASDVSIGARAVCAVRSDQTVWCWSRDVRFGENPGIVHVPLAAPAVDVDATGDAVCALLIDGRVSCWEYGLGGIIIEGPADVGVSHAIAVSTGDLHACAVLDDQSVRCWGTNATGQLGDGSTVDTSTPVSPVGLPPVTALALGTHHTCAVTHQSKLWCWGQRLYGAFGDGLGRTGNGVPVAVPVPA